MYDYFPKHSQISNTSTIYEENNHRVRKQEFAKKEFEQEFQ
jgi:hypothetical protein